MKRKLEKKHDIISLSLTVSIRMQNNTKINRTSISICKKINQYKNERNIFQCKKNVNDVFGNDSETSFEVVGEKDFENKVSFFALSEKLTKNK